MTGPTGDEGLAAALEALARDAAPEVLAQALEAARAEATATLQRRLVRALLDETAHSVSLPAGPTIAAVPPAPGGGAASERGLYVYGFTGGGDPQRVAGLEGVERARTYPVVAGGVIAVVSDVTGRRHGWGIGADGEPDLDLLSPRLVEHERVLEGVLAQGSVLPMRFGTLYTARAALDELLEVQGPTIGDALARVEGKVEWGLTVTWDRRRAGAPDSGGNRRTCRAGSSPGRAYLSQREAEKAGTERAAQDRAELAGALHHRVDRVAVASVMHPPPRSGPRGDGADTLLRSSYLVPRAERDRFEAAIVEGLEAGAAFGLQGELTGPWPPYHFSDLQLESAPS
jgi:hypothetical protein